jgi:hypothetical protein
VEYIFIIVIEKLNTCRNNFEEGYKGRNKFHYSSSSFIAAIHGKRNSLITLLPSGFNSSSLLPFTTFCPGTLSPTSDNALSYMYRREEDEGEKEEE